MFACFITAGQKDYCLDGGKDIKRGAIMEWLACICIKCIYPVPIKYSLHEIVSFNKYPLYKSATPMKYHKALMPGT